MMSDTMEGRARSLKGTRDARTWAAASRRPNLLLNTRVAFRRGFDRGGLPPGGDLPHAHFAQGAKNHVVFDSRKREWAGL